MVNIMRRDPTRDLRRWDPFSDYVPTMNMGRVFERLLGEPFMGTTGFGGLLEEATETMALDITENDRELVVTASVPGFDKDEIDVEIDEGVLTIRARHEEEREEKSEEGERWVRRERRYGSLNRQVVLPTRVMDEQCQAELKNGVLTLRLPKSTEASRRKVQVKEIGGGEGKSAGGEPRKGGDGSRAQQRS